MEVAQLLDSHSDWFSTEGLHFGEMEPLPSIDSDSSLGLFDLLESVQDCRHYSKLASLPTTHDFAPYSDTSSSDSSSGHGQFGTNESLRLPGFCSFSDATSSSMLCFEGLGGVAPKQTIKPQFDPIEWLKNGCTGSYESCSITNEVSSREPPKNKRPPNKCLDQVQTLKKNCVRNENNVDAAVIGTKDPQSIAARNRREKISERLKILQDLVPNGSKVDLVTMLEKAISYVKFLQLQVKILATDEFWPSHGGRVPDITQVQEAMDAIVSSSNEKC